ncbi:MAG: ribosome silencing factor, partial [Luteibaculum sp.]
VYIDLRNLPQRCCDYFLIAHGDSSTQVSAIAGSVEKETSTQLKEKPMHREGIANAEWALLDYGDLVVHIFYRDKREHYNIEGLWADGDTYRIEEEVAIAYGK